MSLFFKILQSIDRIKNLIITSHYKKKFNCKTLYLQYPCRIIGEECIKVDHGFSSLSGLRIECLRKYNNQEFNPELSIGKNVSFNTHCHIGCINGITIGDNVLVGSNVLIIDHSHGKRNEEMDVPPSKRKLWSKGTILIEDNCWIGENVIILPAVKIGQGSIIGAGAVIAKDVPAFSVVVGNPQKCI